MSLYTIGHWRHSEDTFVKLLTAHGVTHLIDVRSFPGSRQAPQFNKETMPGWLGEFGIGYHHVVDLGGRRKKAPEVVPVDLWWEHPSFRNYAGHTRTPQWRSAYVELLELAAVQDVAIMCGEPSRYRCHRRMISDVAYVDGVTAHHIESDGRLVDHEPSGWVVLP